MASASPPSAWRSCRFWIESHGHLSAGEIYQRAVERLPGLTEATVYRTLDFLVSQGLALVAHIGSGRMVYELAVHDHDHLICRKCGDSVEIDHQDLVLSFKHFEQTTGFLIDASHVTFFGLCPDCLATSRAIHNQEILMLAAPLPMHIPDGFLSVAVSLILWVISFIVICHRLPARQPRTGRA